MALLTATRPTALGVAWSPQPVSASDTISATDLGQNGAWLVIINGNAATDNVVVSDSSLTQAGNGATAPTNPVVNGTSEVMYINPKAVNQVTNVVTVTHSVTPTVTYVLLPLG